MFRHRLQEATPPTHPVTLPLSADTADNSAPTNEAMPDGGASDVVVKTQPEPADSCLFCAQGVFSLLVKLGDPDMPWEVSPTWQWCQGGDR